MCSTELSESIVSFPVFEDRRACLLLSQTRSKETWEAFSSAGREISRNKGAFKHTEADTVSQSAGHCVKTL